MDLPQDVQRRTGTISLAQCLPRATLSCRSEAQIPARRNCRSTRNSLLETRTPPPRDITQIRGYSPHMSSSDQSGASSNRPDGRLMDGRSLAKRVRESVADKVRRIIDATGITPALATVLVGDDEASATYVLMKA